MGIYKQYKTLAPTEIDEVATRYSLDRFDNESLFDFKERVIRQSRNPLSQSVEDISFYMNNLVGLSEEPVFILKQKEDISGNILYPFSYFDIDSYFFKIYKHFDDIEPFVQIPYREEPYKFLPDLIIEINSSSILEVSNILNVDLYEKPSLHLKIQNNLYMLSTNLQNSKKHKLRPKICYIRSGDPFFMQNEKNSYDEIAQEGDYYVDYADGFLFTFLKSRSSIDFISLSYPYYVRWQSIKVSPLIDKSIDFLLKEDIVESNGVTKKIVINEYGSKVYKKIFKSYPYYWGK